MKNMLLLCITSVILCFVPVHLYSQVITLGSANNFALFTTVGAVTNTGISQVTGHVGTNVGGSTTFGNVNGNMHDQDTASALAATAVIAAYGQLNGAIPTFFIASPFGNGDTLVPGVYRLAAASVLNQTLYLNAQGNPAAVFIIQVQGTLATAINSKVKLLNGALACNVYWKVEGAVTMNSGSSMKGTVLANNGAIHILTLDTLEGRALSLNGGIDIHNAMISTPVGCGSPVLLGPPLPNIGGLMCYTLFSTIGPVSNTGVTNVKGDIGSNSSSPTGFDSLLVKGKIHTVPDTSTANAATSLTAAYNQMNAMVEDIQLLYPAQFGQNLVLTPHTYLMNGATTLTDTLYLNAMGLPNATFVIKCYGAVSALAGSRVILINGAQAKNVYWMVNGAVSILSGAIFNGTIICASGAMDIASGAIVNGRALTTTGALTTASATINMPPGCGPAFVLQPQNDTICLGDTARFIVNATGTGLTFQWRKGTVNLVDGVRINGATNDTLTIFPSLLSDTANNYNVIVTATNGSDTSTMALLKINLPTLITVDPINQTACVGNTIKFGVKATGTNLVYQWRKGNVNLINGIRISGANSDSLTITATTMSDTASDYNVIVSGACGPNDTSTVAKLTLNGLPVVGVEPTNQTVCAGSSVSFGISTTGTGINYQWRKGNTALANSASVSGVTTPTLTINPATIADTSSGYNVIVSGACGINDTSLFVSLTVNMLPVITVEPVTVNSCIGNSVALNVTATGTGLTYQWRKGNTVLLNAGNISGATAASLVINPALITDTASNYNVIVSGVCAPKDTSNLVAINLSTPANIINEPISQTVCAGGSVSFGVTSIGTGLTYQWRKGNTVLANSASISGVTTSTLTINPTSIADTSSVYNVIVGGSCGANDTSVFVKLTVNTLPVITVEPVNQVACVGNFVTLNVTATGTGLSYQWRKGSVILINGGNIGGATSATLVINPALISDKASNYNVIVSGVCAPSDTSVMVAVMLNTPAMIVNEPVSQTVCEGSSVSFGVNAIGTGLTYQWRKGNTPLANGGSISGVSNSILLINPTTLADISSVYNVIVSGTCLVNDTSVMATLNLNTAPVITTEPVNQIACVGATVQLNVTAGGTALTYQWRNGNVVLANGTTYSGVATATLTINAAAVTDSSSQYNVVISGTCAPNDTSINAGVIVNALPIAVATSNSPVCTQQTIELMTPFITGATYSWSGPNGFTSPLQNASIANATTFYNGVYSIVVTTNGCASIPAAVTVEVKDCPLVDFFIPEGFSPNGDNYNDVFVIRGINRFPNNSINIYNRWGVKVYSASPYTSTWDGTTSMGVSIGGSTLPVGTYFYTLDLGDGSNVIQGSIYLTR